jgi:hypothetical protein
VQYLSDYDPHDADPLPIDPQTNVITYEEVVLVPGINKADLYARTQAWVSRTYNLANADIIQQPDRQLLPPSLRSRKPQATLKVLCD